MSDDLTDQEVAFLEYILDSAQRRMVRESQHWTADILYDGIREMWGGFWTFVSPMRVIPS